jgi:hypothetical protein
MLTYKRNLHHASVSGRLGVGGSNPLAPTNKSPTNSGRTGSIVRRQRQRDERAP